MPLAWIVNIRLAHGNERENRARDQLQALLARYDLASWRYTDEVVIDETSIPHSHPVLTLHTRHLGDDLLLLSTYLHEQLHWFITGQPDERVEPAINALIARYPEPPVGFPQGAEAPLSTYFHYLICFLEYLSVRQVLGETEARRAMAFWQNDHYTEIYRTVMEDMESIARIAAQYDLMPPHLLAGRE